MKKSILGVLALSLGLAFNAQAAETISVGASPVPHAEILEAAKPLLEKEGFELKIVEFNDYVQPNLATDDEQLDANYFQHRPYLVNFSEEHSLKNLQEVATVHIEPMGIYSNKIKDLKDLQEKAVVGIPSDPTNGGRALLLLQRAGLITLEDPENLAASALDIKENKLNLQFKELEAPQLPRSLDDLDVALINTNFALGANLNPLKDALLIENADSPYVNILVANKTSAQKEGMKALVKVLNSDDMKKFIEEKFKGAVIAAF